MSQGIEDRLLRVSQGDPSSVDPRDETHSPISALDPRGNPLSETADFFRGVRDVLNVSEAELAVRLDTEPHVISALETAQINRLPPWPETERVVCSYAKVLSVDPLPALHLLQAAMAQRSAELSSTDRPIHSTPQSGKLEDNHAAQSDPTKSKTKLPPGLARYTKNKGQSSHAATVSRLGKGATYLAREAIAKFPKAAIITYMHQWIARPARPIAITLILAAMLIWSASQGWFVKLAQSSFPGPIASVVRGTNDFILYYTSPKRDGLRWIEVDDPRTRRTDKLPVPEQSD